MKIVYISAQFPQNNEFVKNNSKVMPQYAANHVSRLFFEGMLSTNDKEIETMNLLPIAPWPNGSKCFKVPRMDWIESGQKIEGIPYYNAIGVRQHSKYTNLRKSFMGRLKHWKEEQTCVIAYGLSSPVLKSFEYLKCNAPDLKTCLIVPDLPQYMNVDGNKLYHLLKNIDINMQRKLYKYVDGMVYFSKHMNEFFEFDSDKWIVIEGAVNYKDGIKNKFGEQMKKEADKKIILYSGALEEAYGISDLVQAFMKISKEDYELHIIGSGGGVSVVQEGAKKDERIKYMGVMDHEEVLKHQQAATLLVNPRKPLQELTKYSFPSKTLEYMMSGTPVLMYKLEGIPFEYDEYVTYFTEDDIDVMARQIEEMCEKPLDWQIKKGETAKQFVKEQKNNRLQMLRLCEFVGRI